MLTLKLLREQPEFVIERLAVKNFDATEIVAQILEHDKLRRQYQTELDSVLAQLRIKSKEIGQLMQSGQKEQAEAAKAEVASMKARSKEIETLMEESLEKQNSLLVLL
ncbi:MAG: serine--tRNA ligase, partial [Bacteroidales bacterium]|nr:serine--tRNA ligase [Bacteroidales bacterium]